MEIVLLKAFGNLSAPYYGEVKDGLIKIVTPFQGKDYLFVYKDTYKVQVIRDTQVLIFELDRIEKYGHRQTTK